ncbi:MAG: nickel-dependent lactate racemase [candidate division WOR-3 bacterium]|mgnify:CR=1 FL=1|uniref:Nickel-dependent lactate racemase n=1 Tax=candidate division WOR-3 bacterium TaxID=2052148 RepID=A0A7C1SWP3_UNCW3|nr:nickel-dependent lactate racemase [candidate division WOR-3 bacterium]
MKLEIRYHNQTESIDIPEENLLGILSPIRFDCASGDITAEMKNCRSSVAEFLGSANRILILVNDYTRPTPNSTILELLNPELENRDVKYLIGLGTHRQATELELMQILGTENYYHNRQRIIQHNGKDPAQLFFLGKTSYGTEVWLNREILWAERIITINSIEPHYFAGYTGGRKCFVPGIAAIKTIAQNHGLLLHPASAPLSLRDNPVHLDMTEAAKMVPRPVFSIQLVQNRDHRLLSLRYGDLYTSFEKACQDAWRVFAVPVKERADIILSVLQSPYDINFYQSQRAVEFALPALKPGGIQITVSACYDGVGNDEFVRVLQSCSDPAELLKMSPPETLGWHKAARLARIMQTHRLYTVIPGVAPELLRSVFMHPFNSIQAALDTAFANMSKRASLYIIPDAGAVVPVAHLPESLPSTACSGN